MQTFLEQPSEPPLRSGDTAGALPFGSVVSSSVGRSASPEVVVGHVEPGGQLIDLTRVDGRGPADEHPNPSAVSSHALSAVLTSLEFARPGTSSASSANMDTNEPAAAAAASAAAAAASAAAAANSQQTDIDSQSTQMDDEPRGAEQDGGGIQDPNPTGAHAAGSSHSDGRQ